MSNTCALQTIASIKKAAVALEISVDPTEAVETFFKRFSNKSNLSPSIVLDITSIYLGLPKNRRNNFLITVSKLGGTDVSVSETLAGYKQKLLEKGVDVEMNLLAIFSHYDYAVLTSDLNNKMNPTDSLITFKDGGSSIDSRVVVYKDDESTIVRAQKEDILKNILLTDSGSSLFGKRSTSLAETTADYKKGSSDSWKAFLSDYFTNMNISGAKFSEWAIREFSPAIVNFTKDSKGVLSNIDEDIAALHKKVRDSIEAKLVIKYREELTDKYLEENEDVRDKYFNEVLFKEFDFIIDNLIKSLAVDGAKTLYNNQKVTGVKYNEDDSSMQLLDLTDMLGLLTYDRRAKEYTFKDPIELVDLDMNGASFLSRTDLAPGTLYKTTLDGKVYYKTAESAVDVSPKKYYTLNTKNKHNESSINKDAGVSALDEGTAFINNLITFIPRINKAGTHLGYLTMDDYMVISPFLLEYGNDMEEFIERLDELAMKNDRIGNVAFSLKVHIFDAEPGIIGNDFTDIHSLRNKYNRGIDPFKYNMLAVNALYNALISKEYYRFIRVENGKTIISRELNLEVDDYFLDSNLADMLVTNGYTKASLKALIIVENKGANLYVLVNDVKISIDDDLLYEDILEASELMGFSKFLRQYQEKLGMTGHNKSTVEMKVLDYFKKMTQIAAANIKIKKGEHRWYPGNLNSNASDKSIADYTYIRPSSLLYGIDYNIIGEIYNPDTTRNARVAGASRNTISAPNRNGSLSKQVKMFKATVEKRYGVGIINFNPIVFDDSPVPKADYKGYYVKTPIKNGDNILGVHNWDMKTRVEYAMHQGFLDGPSRIQGELPGENFFVQPTNNADKKNVHMMKLFVEGARFFSSDSKAFDNLKQNYIDYHTKKNEDFQLMMIYTFRETVMSQFTSIYNALETSAQKEAFQKLVQYMEKTDFSNKIGDFTRVINSKLKGVGLTEDMIKFSNSELILDADYVRFPDGKVYLNPVMGIKSVEFRDNGSKIVDDLLNMHREDLIEFGVDNDKIENSLKFIANKNKDTFSITDADTFYDRFFLINGIYGHAVKTLTMGDESFFMTGKTIAEMGVKTIDGFYRKRADVIYTQKAMLTGQFKRSQSNITSGNKIRQSNTVIGLQLHNSKKNLINHAQIREHGIKIYTFKALEDRPLIELRGEGVIPNGGKLYVDGNGGMALDLIVGNVKVRFNPAQEHAAATMNELGISLQMFNDIALLINNVYKTNAHNAVEGNIAPNFTALDTQNITQSTLDAVYDKMGRKNSITMPDYIPSILLTEPISHISLMNSIDDDVENIDGAQYIHPLLHLIMNYARGGKFSAYNLEQNEALKTIATTFDYSRFTHTLQKKAVFMPFSIEQMQKLSGVEMYNALVKMGTSIEFMKTSMSFTENGVTTTIEANNLHELFEALGGYNITPDVIWERVLNALMQNPVNLFSFVGYLSLPSLVKTGRRKYNQYGEFFNNIKSESPVHIDYTSQEHSYEVLNKAHDYDVTKGSKIALLSQLVNAIANGGVSEITNETLHNAISAAMEVSKTSLLMDFKNMGAELALSASVDSVPIYDKIVKMFNEGNIDPKALNKEEVKVYNSIIRETMQSVLMKSLDNDDDVEIVRQLLKDSNKSLDTPVAYSKVMNTMRSYLYKVIKLKMNGFIAVVSPMHNNVKMFTTAENERMVRGAFIKATLLGLRDGKDVFIKQDFDTGGSIIQYTPKVAEAFSRVVLPFDPVLVNNKGNFLMKTFGSLTESELAESPIFGVSTPDFDGVAIIDTIEAFNEIDALQLVSIGGGRPYYKWYIEQKYGAEVLVDLAKDGAISLNNIEKYTLNWYQYKNAAGIDFRETPVFKNFYTALMDKELDHIVAKFRGRVVMSLKSTGKGGKAVWVTTPPEVILPAFMKGAFNLPANISLHTIIGYDGNNLANAETYFKSKIKGKDFKPLVSGQTGVFRASIQRKYNARFLFTSYNFIQDILNILNDPASVDSELVSDVDIARINVIIENARLNKANETAHSFIESLSVVLTRIPGQAKQSGFNGIIVEFLGAQGNAAMAPSEHMISTGGDFDIDTFSILTSSLTVEGLIFKFKQYIDGSGKFDKKGFLDSYNAKLRTVDDAVDKFAANQNKYINSLISKLEAEEDGAIVNAEAISTFKEKLFTPERKLKKKREIKEIVVTEYNNIVGNVIKNSISRALDNPRAAVEVNTAVTMDYLKELKNIAAAFNNIEDVAVAAEAYTSIFKAEELAAQGAEAIAIFASSLKVYSAILTSKHIFDTYYKGKSTVRKRSLLFKDVMPITNRSVSFTSFYSLSGDYSLSKLMSGGSSVQYSDTKANADVSAVIMAGDPSMRGLQDSRESNLVSFNVTLKMPLVLDNIPAIGVEAMLSDASTKGHDGVIIKANNAVTSIVYILQPENTIDDSSINEGAKVTEAEVFNPFEFEHSIEFTDPETGNKIKRYSTGYADTISFSIEKIINNEEDVRKSLISLSNGATIFEQEKVTRLVEILTAATGEKDLSADFFNGVIKAQFNIEDKSITSRLLLEEYLQDNPDAVEEVYMFILGKRKSDEVQSQLLSAATDNAKELILGKIRSNEFTNGVFTSMLLLGYDLEDIIRFVHDKEFDAILVEAKEKKRNFEFAKISVSMVGDNTPFTRSLSSLIRISDNLSIFRGVRSLNEDFKIDQFRLDKIFNNLDNEKLYEAIKSNDISLLSSITKGRDSDEQKDNGIFVPEIFVFLHPQSRAMFIQMYEIEKIVLPSLVETPALVAELAVTESEDSYKKVEAYVAEMKVLHFLSGTKKVAYIYNKDNAITGETVEQLPLALQKDREIFVSNFPDYLNYVGNKLKDLGKSKPAIFEFLGAVKFMMSTYSTISIPGLKFSLLDPIKKAVIGSTVTELKVVTGDTEVDALIDQLYSNLSLYALITSGGKAGKDSMLGLFSEINLELGDFLFVNGLTAIRENAPKEDDELALLSGTLKSDSELLAISKKKKKKRGYEETEAAFDASNRGGLGQDEGYDRGSGFDEAHNPFENLDDEGKRRRKIYDKFNKDKYKKTEVGYKVHIAKRIYTSNTAGMEGVEFLGADNYMHVPIRIFPIGRKEVMSNDIVGAVIDIPGYSSKIASRLANQGKQLGYSIVYKGSKDAKVLTFMGSKGVQKEGAYRNFHEYLIFADGELLTVPAEAILIENPGLFLYGNVIEDVNNFNIEDRASLYSDVEEMYEKIGPMQDGYNTAYSIRESVADVFGIEELKGSSSLMSEAVAMSMADTVIKVDDSLGDPNLAKVLESTRIPKADEYSNSIFVPGIRFNTMEDFDIGKESYYKEVSNTLNPIINALGIGESVHLYASAELSNSADSDVTGMFSGYNAISIMFGVKTASNTVLRNKNLNVKVEEIDKTRKITRYTITRTSKYSEYRTMMEGKNVKVQLERDNGKVQKLSDIQRRAVIKMVYDGAVYKPATSVKVLRDADGITDMVMFFNGRNQIMYSIENADTVDAIVRRVKKEGEDSKYIKVVDSVLFDTLVNDIKEKSSSIEVINNLKC